jgi:hypothetical protein
MLLVFVIRLRSCSSLSTGSIYHTCSKFSNFVSPLAAVEGCVISFTRKYIEGSINLRQPYLTCRGFVKDITVHVFHVILSRRSLQMSSHRIWNNTTIRPRRMSSERRHLPHESIPRINEGSACRNQCVPGMSGMKEDTHIYPRSPSTPSFCLKNSKNALLYFSFASRLILPRLF